MKLARIAIRNFRGIRERTIESPNGENIRLTGTNGTQKTSVGDALTWLLFDKDTLGRSPSGFGIKTRALNADGTLGDEIHNLEHSVEADFIEGKISFKKIYQENWVKPRGAAKSELAGHTVSYYVDDVPVKKKEYTEAVESIMSEELFKMLTIPSHFAGDMHWSDRRRILQKMAGKVDQEMVLDSDPALSRYPDILDGKSEEGRKSILNETRKKLLKEIDNIPSRIDENMRMIEEVEGVDEAQKEVEKLTTQKKQAEKKKSELEVGGGVAEISEKIASIRAEKSDAETAHSRKHEESLSDLRKEISDLRSKKDGMDKALSVADKKLSTAQTGVSDKEAEVKELTDSLEKKKAEKPKENLEGETCFNCGAEMEPEGDYDAYLKEFNSDKANAIKALESEIELAESFLEAQKEKAEEAEKEVQSVTKKIEAIEGQIEDAESKLDKAKEKIPDFDGSEFDKEIEALEKQAKEIKSDREAHVSQAQSAIDKLQAQIDEKQKVLNIHESNQKAQARIKELQGSQKKTQVQLEEVEDDLHVIQLFEVARNQVVTDRVNEKFEFVTWRMYEEQINGGINDQICEAYFKGSPYTSGCSNGERVAAGIDIINTLSREFDRSAPVIIDNMESVTWIPDTDLQLIQMIVDEKQKKLNVKVG